MTVDQTINKIKKLLRLSRSPNHHEAMAALAKAHDLANASGIAIEGINPDVDPARITHEHGSVTRRTYARKLVSGILKHHFSVSALGCSTGCIYVGPEVNIAIAKHVEAFLLSLCAREWLEHVSEFKIRKSAAKTNRRKTFETFFFVGVGQVLRERPIRNDSSEVNEAIDKYSKDNFGVKTTKLEMVKSSKNHNDSMRGFQAGRRVDLSWPVESGPLSKRLDSAPKALSTESTEKHGRREA